MSFDTNQTLLCVNIFIMTIFCSQLTQSPHLNKNSVKCYESWWESNSFSHPKAKPLLHSMVFWASANWKYRSIIIGSGLILYLYPPTLSCKESLALCHLDHLMSPKLTPHFQFFGFALVLRRQKTFHSLPSGQWQCLTYLLKLWVKWYIVPLFFLNPQAYLYPWSMSDMLLAWYLW